MLKSEHLHYTLRGGQAYPKLAKPSVALPLAQAVLDTVAAYQFSRKAELDEALAALEGDSTHYNLVRGLAHLALAEATFETKAPIEPHHLRQQAFALAASTSYGERETAAALQQLSQGFGLSPEELSEALYADLPQNQILCHLPNLNAQALLDRYNLAQTQGLLYGATRMVIQAHRNQVGEYKKLFRYLKFFRLMFAVEGDLDSGYRITVDGPASLFAQTRRYGVQMAALLPALLNVSKWELTADVLLEEKQVQFAIDSRANLKSHYPKPPDFDSMLESTFAQRFAKLGSPWQLEREVQVVDLKGTVFLPDFALRHPDGRVVHLEIVGFWHPEYLKRKLEKIRAAQMSNLLLAVSERLALSDEALHDLPAQVIRFKGQLKPEAVLAALESFAPLES